MKSNMVDTITEMRNTISFIISINQTKTINNVC